MKSARPFPGLANRLVFAALLVCGFQLFTPGAGSGQQAGWSGSAGMKSGCVGWNCDGKNPCTGMGCDGSSSTKDSKTGSTKTRSSSSAPSSAMKYGEKSSESSKASSTKTKSVTPDVEALTGKAKKNDGWSGDRNSDTRTNDQRNQSDAKKTVDALQGLTGGGKSVPGGWDGRLKSDSRTIEQKLDTP